MDVGRLARIDITLGNYRFPDQKQGLFMCQRLFSRISFQKQQILGPSCHRGAARGCQFPQSEEMQRCIHPAQSQGGGPWETGAHVEAKDFRHQGASAHGSSRTGGPVGCWQCQENNPLTRNQTMGDRWPTAGPPLKVRAKRSQTHFP